MEKRICGLISLGLGAALMGCKGGPIVAQAQTNRKVSLVVYANGFGMVREVRPSQLVKGRTLLNLPDISSDLDPSSIILSWPNAKSDPPSVASTVYQAGASDSGEVLKRFEGREVELIWPSDNGHEGDRLKGTLESAAPNNLVIRSGEQYFVNPAGTIVASSTSSIPVRSSLRAEIESTSDRSEELGFNYLTGGLSWSADYVAKDNGENEIALECLASVTNQTGTDYPDADITFVAGGLNVAVQSARRQPQSYVYGRTSAKAADISGYMSAPRAEMPAQVVGELVSYKATNKASILNGETNRVGMFAAPKVKVRRKYSIGLPELYEWSYPGDWNSAKLPATLALEFKNDQESGLGRRLPGGTVRLYDEMNSEPVYVGASSIADTTLGGDVSLTVSNVFDVSAQVKHVKVQRPKKGVRRFIVEATISNQKAKAVDVVLSQNVAGVWEIVSESSQHLPAPGNQLRWKLNVPSKSNTKLSYSVDVRY